MTKEPKWTKEDYDRSLSSRCWWYTPYDSGEHGNPNYWQLASRDDELRHLVEMEMNLDPVPEWARKIIGWIRFLPPCGHYLFPEPFLQLLSIIGSADLSVVENSFHQECYTVECQRKKAAMDYCLCLDAWLAGTTPEVPARELEALGYRKIDWHSVCGELWKVLGEHTERKDLLVELTLHALRHSIKASRWDDDKGTEFGRDQYLGDYAVNPAGCAVFRQGSSPRLQRLEARLSELYPDWRSFSRVDYGFWWLCAPKAFRFLERDLWAIGKERPLEKGEEVPGFLQCTDTYPNQDEAAEWYRSFCEALQGWWQEHPGKNGVADDVNQRLGKTTPVKRWLVRLFLRKLKRLEENGEQFTSLVNPLPSHRRGARSVKLITKTQRHEGTIME